jgi:hypothetical protein
MKRKPSPEREHVVIYTTERRDDGRKQFTVCWTPAINDRRRKVFTDEQKANELADEVEALMGSGLSAITRLCRKQLVAIAAFLEANDDHDGSILYRLLNSQTSQGSFSEALVKELGELFIKSRTDHPDTFGVRRIKEVRQHVNRFIGSYGTHNFAKINTGQVEDYLEDEIGGEPKTRLNHIITLQSWWNWARDVGADGRKFLPRGEPTAIEAVIRPKVKNGHKQVYTPEQFTRLLVFMPADMIEWAVIGHFSGIRASSERLKLTWDHWLEEHNQISMDERITKTSQFRNVEVEPNLREWLQLFKGKPTEWMCPQQKPYDYTPRIAKAAGVPWLHNALRHGYVSYHVQKYRDLARTAANAGHTQDQLKEYLHVRGVTPESAAKMFNITPTNVLAFAKQHKLPTPEWAPAVSLRMVA